MAILDLPWFFHWSALCLPLGLLRVCYGGSLVLNRVCPGPVLTLSCVCPNIFLLILPFVCIGFALGLSMSVLILSCVWPGTSSGPFLVYPWSSLVLSLFCPGSGLVLLLFCAVSALRLSWSCPVYAVGLSVSVLFLSCVWCHTSLALPWYIPTVGLTSVSSGSVLVRPGSVLCLSWLCLGSNPDPSLSLSWWFCLIVRLNFTAHVLINIQPKNIDSHTMQVLVDLLESLYISPNTVIAISESRYTV